MFLDVLRAQEAKPAAKNYFVKLVCESADKIVTVRFDGTSAKIVATANTRILQSDISGPHGIVFSQTRKLILYPSATDDRSVLQ